MGRLVRGVNGRPADDHGREHPVGRRVVLEHGNVEMALRGARVAVATRFNGSTDFVEFAIAPLVGAAHGPVTIAAYFLRNSVGAASQTILALTDSALANKEQWFLGSDFPNLALTAGTLAVSAPQVLNSTTVWYIAAVTKPSGSSPARFHFHNGAVWTHTTSPSSVAANAAVAASDRLRVAARATPNFKADVVCVGI